jgi:tetratricopeptide (TPR) repeat protein
VSEPTPNAPTPHSGGHAAEDLFQRGLVLLYRDGDVEAAEALWVEADAMGHGGAATHLGLVAFHERKDRVAAEVAYARGAARGDVLHERGELAEAQAAFVRADERGHGGGAFNLGLMLEAHGDSAGARAAYLRAHERGEAGADQALRRLLSAS